jgi:uncharacterized protein
MVASTTDGYSKVVPVSSSRITLDSPTLLAGFPDSGMIGSITLNQIIEQLQMHQIASVESRYVMPAAIFIGRKFRHPFRIYANNSGTICALICEVPVLSSGIHSIVEAIVNWSVASKIGKVIVLGGILPSNFNPSQPFERRPLLLTNVQTEEVTTTNNKLANDKNNGHHNHDEQNSNNEDGNDVDAIIAGLPGALLSAYSAYSVKCTALMMPAISEAPDPEGAAILLESLAKIDPTLKMDVAPLRHEVERLRKRLQEFLEMRERQMREYERSPARSETEAMYK